MPAAHNVHPELPASEYMPRGHSVAAVAPPVAARAPLTEVDDHVAPASLEWYISPPVTTADSRVKSPDAATPLQPQLVPAPPPSGFQFAPASTDLYNAPLPEAIILVKSADVATPSQFAVGELSDVHDVPLLPVYWTWPE